MLKVIILIELSLSCCRNAKGIEFVTFEIVPAASRSFPGASRSFRKSRNAKSDRNRIITFVLPAASKSFRELPGASRELPGRAGMLKVIIGIEL